MLSLRNSDSAKGKKVVANLLPCQIHHDGAVDANKRYWDPQETADGTSVAYFRGRKLMGKTLPVPKGYRGVILQSTDEKVPALNTTRPVTGDPVDLDDDDQMDADDPGPEMQAIDEIASFEKIVVWDHEMLPDQSENAYMKGMQEWISFAEAANARPEETEKP